MGVTETIAGLVGFDRRGPGTDAERQAADWLAGELRSGGADVRLEPFWSRPNWALAHTWHAALGLAGGLVSVSSPAVGGTIVLIALLSLIADVFTGQSLGRRLTFERASQNVVARGDDQDDRVRLIITANCDAGRMGLIYRDRVRALAARMKSATGGLAPGWVAWVAVSLAALLVVAIVRNGGTKGAGIGIIQLIPTVALVLAIALLLEHAGSAVGPAASDNAGGVAAAVALFRALDAAPPSRLAVELVLQGAADASAIGLRRHLRARRGTRGPTNTVVLGIAACGAGTPRWWTSDGALLPMRFHARLRALCEQVAADEAHLGAAPYRGRGTSPALPGRIAGIPSITIGCLDERGLPPRSHLPTDTPERIDQQALEATLTLALALVDAIDADLPREGQAAPAAAAGV
jgi:hypothetical protein